MATEAVSVTVANGDYSPVELEQLDFTWAPPLFEHHIHSRRRVKIICVGTGFSGLCAAVYLKHGLENFDLQIYEKTDDVGGVWHQNRYAGAACDVPSHSYQFSFCEQTQWSSYYAPRSEIHGYLRRVADEYNLRPDIKHEVTKAIWDAGAGKWHVEVKDLRTGSITTDSADFFIHATGLLSQPMWPDIKGLHDFKGELRHSGTWDTEKEEARPGFTWENKRVAVIGNGASAVQIVPELLRRGAKHVKNFGRSTMWLSSGWGSKVLSKLTSGALDGTNYHFTPELKASFSDPATYLEFRREIEGDLASGHGVTLQGHPLQKIFREKLGDLMDEKSSNRPHVSQALKPDYPVGCKRLTPGPGYLEALCGDQCDLITQPIDRFTEKGVLTTDGVEHEVDFIICATGFDVRQLPAFPIYGTGGTLIQDAWADEPRTYMGIAARELPNFFNLLTIQSAVGSGSQLVILERFCDYLTQVIDKCQRDHYKSVVVKQKAIDDFLRYTDTYFKRTVYTTNCRSWFKKGQKGDVKIRTIWPGGGLHCFQALKHPRWEDYEWEKEDELEHSMSWLGNGDIDAAYDRDFAYREMKTRTNVYFGAD